MDIIKVASDSRPAAVAGAIAGVVRERGKVDVRAIGASAVNQAVEAVSIARTYLLREGIDVACIPSFSDVVIDGVKRTAVNLEVFVLPKQAPQPQIRVFTTSFSVP